MSYVIPYIPTSISTIYNISMLQLMRMRHDTTSTQRMYCMYGILVRAKASPTQVMSIEIFLFIYMCIYI